MRNTACDDIIERFNRSLLDEHLLSRGGRICFETVDDTQTVRDV